MTPAYYTAAPASTSRVHLQLADPASLRVPVNGIRISSMVPELSHTSTRIPSSYDEASSSFIGSQRHPFCTCNETTSATSMAPGIQKHYFYQLRIYVVLHTATNCSLCISRELRGQLCQQGTCTLASIESLRTCKLPSSSPCNMQLNEKLYLFVRAPTDLPINNHTPVPHT